MTVYEFDARIAVEAASREEAADLILEHCMDGADIAVALFAVGSLNRRKSTFTNAPVAPSNNAVTFWGSTANLFPATPEGK